ncbi:hypothetical protein JTE90_022351 [Oedothorax gibbosus]|uniref:Uncharacterized protein n=1 Tax=Oedothorax gibbosus TaxID=931172 RepID=A0AAV6VYC9_9ARAC|nr:hypothetical protein JTE90_022351 [Oedothorax gibbosus]
MSLKINGSATKLFESSMENFKKDGDSTNLQMLAAKEKRLQSLVHDFLVYKISVAGVSNIVDSRSSKRRFIWFLGVLGCTLFMGYMTLNVILEYRRYPKNLIKEDIIVQKLIFPAVTICSLNPISSHYVEKTSLRRFIDLKKMLMDEATSEKFDPTVRDQCLVQPLCKWSWFQELCNCVKDPCLTEFCLAENGTHCTCSSTFCRNDVQENVTCRNEPRKASNQRRCLCKGTSTHGIDDEKAERGNFDDLLDSISNAQVREVVRLIKSSKTYDLMGVEEAMMPTTQELYDYGQTFDSLVGSCSFDDNACNRENFTVLYHPIYGKCFMFNFAGVGNTSVDAPIEINSYGSQSGLQLLLRVTDRYALDLFRREIGARIVIHDPHVFPFVGEFGVNVRPGDMTSLEVALSKVERLPQPYGNCEDENTKLLFSGDPYYTILGCEKYCSYKQMTAHCNCTMRHFLRGSVLNVFQQPFPLCNFSDEAQRKCSNAVTQEIEHRTECVCLPPCRETVYSYSVTASELNENFYSTVKAIRTLKLDSNGQKKYINYTDSKSMVGVKVYYNSFQVSSHIEIPSYSWETLVANIGGNFGFFMGLTIVTFLEIAEFLWDCICTVFTVKKNVSPKPEVDRNVKKSLTKSEQNAKKEKIVTKRPTTKRRTSI